MGHLPALDGVRGLAILLVMVFHFGQVLSGDAAGVVEPCLARLATYGRLGVDLFFVLSGFLITGILLDTKGSRTYFSAFYMRRALRIVPLYLAFLAYVFGIYRIVYYSKFGIDPIPGPDALWFVTYLSNWSPSRGTFPGDASHLWSLAVEEQFYLIWPLVVFACGRRGLALVCVAGVVSALGVRVAMEWRHAWWESLHRLTPARMDTLCLGALAALAIRDGRWRGRFERHAARCGLVLASGVVALVVAEPWPAPGPLFDSLGLTLVAMTFACLVSWTATAGERSRLFRSRAMRALGRYSYGIYVLHVLAFRIAPPDRVATSAVAIKLASMLLLGVISCGLARASWTFLESPFLRWKGRFPYRPGREDEDGDDGGPGRRRVARRSCSPGPSPIGREGAITAPPGRRSRRP